MQPPRLTALSKLPLGIRDSACFTCFSQQTVYFSPDITGLDDGASMTPNGGAHRGSYRAYAHHPQHGSYKEPWGCARRSAITVDAEQRSLRSETIRQVLDDVRWSDVSHHNQNKRQNVTDTVLCEAHCAF